MKLGESWPPIGQGRVPLGMSVDDVLRSYKPPNLDPLGAIAKIGALLDTSRVLVRVRVNERMHQKILDTAQVVNGEEPSGAILMYGVPLVCDLPSDHPNGVECVYR